MEAVPVKSAEHGHLTHAESNEFTSTRNQDECVEIKVTSQGEETSTKDVKDCGENVGIIVDVVPSVPPVISNDDNLKPLEELVVYTEEMAFFHRHEITSPRYSFNIPTNDQPVKDELLDHHENDDVFMDEDREVYNPLEEQLLEENKAARVDVEPLRSDVHISQGLLAYEYNSIPIAPWAYPEEPQNCNSSGSGKDMFAIPKLSDLYDDGEGILGVVMTEERGNEVEVDTHHWGYSHQSYDPGYGTPLRMMDYYDSVDSAPGQDGGNEEKKEEGELQDTEISVEVKVDDIDVVKGEDNNEGDKVIDHETLHAGGYQVKYCIGDVEQSTDNLDSAFVHGDTVNYGHDQISGRQRRLSSYDNTVTPDDKILTENLHIHPLESVTLKDIVEKPEETISAETQHVSQEPNNQLLPSANKQTTDGNGSNNALTPEYQMTTTSSGDTSPALRECTAGVRVTSRDSLAGVAPDWEESPSSSDDAGDLLEKLAISNISSAYGQTPVIRESEGTVKTNVSLVSKLKKEFGEGLILPSLQPTLTRGNEKPEKSQEMVVGQEKIENEGQQQSKEDPREQLQDKQQRQQHKPQIVTKDHDLPKVNTDFIIRVTGTDQLQPSTVTESEVDLTSAGNKFESIQGNVIGDSEVTARIETARVTPEVKLGPEQIINKNILNNKRASSEEMRLYDQEADKRKLLITGHNQSDFHENDDRTWLDHGQNKIINKVNNDNTNEIGEETRLRGSCEDEQEKAYEKSNKLLCQPVDNVELSKDICNDVQEGTHDVLEERLDTHVASFDVNEGTLNVHKGRLDVHEGTVDVKEEIFDEKNVNVLQENARKVPDITVTQDKEACFGEHKPCVDQLNDTEKVTEVDLGSQQWLDFSNSDDKLNALSKDKSSFSSDTTKSFPENSLNSIDNFEKPPEDDSSAGNVINSNKETSSGETETSHVPQHNNPSTMKRRASLSDSVTRDFPDDKRQKDVKMTGKDPKPPPKGSSKRCVNAR